jgi:hypothetical protein
VLSFKATISLTSDNDLPDDGALLVHPQLYILQQQSPRLTRLFSVAHAQFLLDVPGAIGIFKVDALVAGKRLWGSASVKGDGVHLVFGEDNEARADVTVGDKQVADGNVIREDLQPGYWTLDCRAREAEPWRYSFYYPDSLSQQCSSIF